MRSGGFTSLGGAGVFFLDLEGGGPRAGGLEVEGGGRVAGCVLVGGEDTDSSCKPQSASTNAGLRRSTDTVSRFPRRSSVKYLRSSLQNSERSIVCALQGSVMGVMTDKHELTVL